ncbi:MAG: ribosomal RNA small subunit methyltransferase A, partial [Planctomycetes bacterium]|nr:ribosomal RNA small subunit methyltransferase A [Planctomycetota bacterium]
MASPRQTVSYLTRRFNEVGLIPDTRHGQNFLVDLNLVELLVRSADIQPDDLVLEVGTGTGSLTAMLAARAGEVITVEIDAHLYQLAAESLVEFSNITMLHQDALRNKNNLHADLLATIRERLNASDGTAKRFKLVANLPFNIATPIVSNLLLTDVVPTSMTITIQKELADRMTACPGTKDYNALSIWMQALCDTEIIRVLPPSVFWPRP